VGSTQPGGMAYRIETEAGVKVAAWSWSSQSGTQANALISTFKA